MDTFIGTTNSRLRERASLLERFLKGSSDEISYLFIKDLHLAKDTEALLLLRYCHCLLEKEIADALNIDERTVRQRLTDAKYDMEIAFVGKLMAEFHIRLREKQVDIPSVESVLKCC